MLSRDSIIWWLAIAGAVITYLLSAEPPTQWDYKEWLQAISFVVATVSGKLATSPLVGKESANVGAQTARVEEAKRMLVQAKELSTDAVEDPLPPPIRGVHRPRSDRNAE